MKRREAIVPDMSRYSCRREESCVSVHKKPNERKAD